MELTQNQAVGELEESCLDLLAAVSEKSKNFRQLASVGVKLGERRSGEIVSFQCNHEEPVSLDEKKDRLEDSDDVLAARGETIQRRDPDPRTAAKVLQGILSCKTPALRNLLHKHVQLTPPKD